MKSVLFATVLTFGVGLLYGQTDPLLDQIQILDPSLTASVVFSTAAGDCPGPAGSAAAMPCALSGYPMPLYFTAADGSVYGWTETTSSACPGPRAIWTLTRTKPDKTINDVLRIITELCLTCSQGICTQESNGYTYVSGTPDVVNGVLRIPRSKEIVNCSEQGCQLVSGVYGMVAISGFPRLLDTLLTFTPGGALTALLPGLPDGFRSADSMQLWTGDVRSMPDWSQAQPLACMAATSPTPGQVVTVPDTLPDPTVGHARYYLAGSVSGTDRRLGRQFVNGAFSSRDPASLPACSP